jgi:hypothetical protein
VGIVVVEGEYVFGFAFGSREWTTDVGVNSFTLASCFYFNGMERLFVLLGANARLAVGSVVGGLDCFELLEY